MVNTELTRQVANVIGIGRKRNIRTNDPTQEAGTKEMTGKMLARWPRTIALIAGDAGRMVIGKARSTERQSRRTRTFEPVELIPLDHAVLCEDCQMISRARNDHCLSCGSHAILRLVNVLGSQSTTGFQHKPSPTEAEPETFQKFANIFRLRRLPDPE